jgi:hypothetical protein
MSRIRQLRIETLEADLKKLDQDYRDVGDKKRRESNPQEQNNLGLQLQEIGKDIDDVEKRLEELKQKEEEDKTPTLINLLTSFKDKKISTHIKKAYQACCPEDWFLIAEEFQEIPERILVDLETMPKGSSRHTAVERFVACLLAYPEIPLSVVNELSSWANQNINAFPELLNQEKENLDQRRKTRESCLLVVLERSTQNSVISQNSDRYTVNVWIIPDVQAYNYQNGCGCENLILENSDSKSFQQNFTIDEIPQLLNIFIDKSSKKYSLKNLRIELFLPLELLNYAVDSWALDEDFGFSTPIGQDYKVVVRSYERLTARYSRRREFWENKWEALQRFKQSSACSAFLLGDEDKLENLISELKSPEVIGLKLAKAPVKLGKGSILAAILDTAIPVALWLRQNLPGWDCQSEIDQILDCCIHNLPESVKQKRLCAPLGPNTHIGHHLSLLWEDPYRLPPTIDYSM